ncbi:hypothetical protein BDV3_003473 [Batrachochytrium dendrobatidis]
MKKTTSNQPVPPRPTTKVIAASIKEKRPASGGLSSRSTVSELRSIGKPKAAKGGKLRDAEDATDETVETKGPKEGDASLSWLYLTQENIDELKACEPDDELGKLAQIIGMPLWKDDIQCSILMSFYYSNYYFSKENKFSPIQISVFFSIMKLTLDKSLEKSLTHTQTLSEFKKLLFDSLAEPSSPAILANSTNQIEDPTSSIFEPAECKLIIDYAMTTLFQHFKLFHYVFNNDQEKQEVSWPVALEIPFSALPLSDADTFEVHEAEKAAREQTKAGILDVKGLSYTPDILGVLPPDELKQTALENISELLEGLSGDFDRMLLDQRQRFLNQISKLSTTKE